MSSANLSEKPTDPWDLRRHSADVTAGFVVSLVALVFGLAIAEASGAEPITGLYSGIIAGFAAFLCRGGYVTVSGPAAGLAPVLFASCHLLGGGDMIKGFGLLSVAIVCVGIIQIAIALMKWASVIGEVFPAGVTHAMLAGIGLLIIVKEIPLLLGFRLESHGFGPMLLEMPGRILDTNMSVFAVGGTCLALVFLLGWIKDRFELRVLKYAPPQVIVVFVGLAIGLAVSLDHAFLVDVPSPFEYGLVLPNFSGVFEDSSLLPKFLLVVVQLTIIDMVETLATIKAVDAKDVYHRRSDPNRVLLGIGLGNLLCGMIGRALTNIPGGLKSNMAIGLGARTLWTSFYCSVFLCLFLFLGRHIINLLPMSALAAVIIYTGWKLCKPQVWIEAYKVGKGQLLVFIVTAGTTVFTDLLYGIIAGVVMEFVLIAYYSGYFTNPIVRTSVTGKVCTLYIDHPLVCFNFRYLEDALAALPENIDTLMLRFNGGVKLVDHTSSERLQHLKVELEERGILMEIVGLDTMQTVSEHPSAVRVRTPDYQTVNAD
jgi:MFS superfamily sulfate permease-like transporter